MGRLGTSCRVAALALASAAAFSCGDDDEGASGGDGGLAGGGGGASSATKLDACRIVTEQDASALFGDPATRDEGPAVVDPALLGRCLWTYEVEDEVGSTTSQLLQLYVWDGAAHSVPPGSEPLDVGEDGYVDASEAIGVDIGWVQDDRAILLSYFSIGDDMPANLSRVEPMKTLAQEVSDRL